MLRLSRRVASILQALAMLMLGHGSAALAQITFPLLPQVPVFVSGVASQYVQPDGKTVHVGHMGQDGSSYAVGVARTNRDGTPDTTFGTAGLVELAVFGFAEQGRFVIAPTDGTLLVGANVVDPSGMAQCLDWTACNNYIALFRINSDGSPDLTFNRSGRLVMHIGDVVPGKDEASLLDRTLIRLSLLPDGKIAVHGRPVEYDAPLPVIARVHANGYLDMAFARADNGDAAREVNLSIAMEFYNGNLGKFFVTSDVNEIVALRRNAASGWSWAGGGFHVFPAAAGLSGVPVCRFYGRPEAGLDSHVLSANAAECALLESQHGDAWILESRSAFRVTLPDPGTGTCPAGQAPIYRLWNGLANGGHHLTSALSLRTLLLSFGYIAEGWGPDGVAMCAAP